MTWQPWQDVLALVELAAPSACAGCARPGVRWCRGCDGELVGTPGRSWTPTPCPRGMPPTWSGPDYAGSVRAAVVAWKDGGRADLTAVFAPVLRCLVAAALSGSRAHLGEVARGGHVVIVPAPSARAGNRARGEHRVERLTRAAVHGIPTSALRVGDVLRMGRVVADQAGLTARERQDNLVGAMTLRRRGSAVVQGRPCIVVDDVVTTGATLVECARALREGGSGPVLAVTLAATVRRAGHRLPQPGLHD